MQLLSEIGPILAVKDEYKQADIQNMSWEAIRYDWESTGRWLTDFVTLHLRWSGFHNGSKDVHYK